MGHSQTNHKPRILVLFSDTGGGHRSAAEAILEALNDSHHGEFEPDMVDVFKTYAPYPLNRMPDWYPDMVKSPNLWRLGYRAMDGRHRARFVMDSIWPWVRPAAKQLVREHPADLVLNVHPLFNSPVLRALGKHHPPFVTVVTDLVTAPNFWFHRRVDFCVVPTEEVESSALLNGLEPSQIRLYGLPVGKRFGEPADKTTLRIQLGWPMDRKVVLLIGGGEGMGPLYDTAREIARLNPDCALSIIAGRNAKLKHRLENFAWEQPVFVYGFVSNMPDFMRAADILVTKAGPGTICEALNAGLPIILYSRIPGQEDGNVRYVMEEGAGRWAPGAERTALAVQKWLSNPDLRNKAAEACTRIARPQAARMVADLIWTLLPREI
jgi:1,2-diacylglycerol 3-beta-galactosyltransferase